MYSPQLLDHFRNPRNAGELSNATATVEMENPVCGDVLKLSARVENGRIVAARFLVQGCTAAIACASVLTTWMTGRELGSLGEIAAEGIAAELGGLPEASRHAAQLAADALRALISKVEG